MVKNVEVTELKETEYYGVAQIYPYSIGRINKIC